MKRALILGVLCTLINFSSITEANSIKYLAETTSTETSGSTGATGESGGNQSSSAGSGTTGGSSTPNSNGNVDKVESANPEVELDGAIGPWEPDNKDMPNFDNIQDGDLIGTKPSDDKLFKISVTVPLNMDFMIVNRLENGGSFYGKFVSPYHSITNNGTYPLNVSLNSFTRADESSNSSGTARTNSSSKDTKLYVEEPQAGNNKVEMRLSLNYDRPQQGTYLKTINLHTLNESTTSEEKQLGEIGSNETARIYYRSDLWETPKSEGIEADVVSNFNLILSFSTQNTNAGIENGAGGSAGTGSEGNASSTPSSGNITSGGSNEGADSGSGSTGSGENSALQNPSES
ncbi:MULTISPECIES: hypothetical protein [Clostridia]|uniref:Uncharacterized protein n=2 Tax=Clostridia TaxID=186801 RepID=A0A8I0A6V5_9CLOT|nr:MULTISPECIES: hypothetical protein [Clostridia]MBC5641203.1 hypothetical protein [Clostridium lentum]MBC5655402.1 hypothetical protein [Blautia lenta]